jgi:hypothetical protein
LLSVEEQIDAMCKAVGLGEIMVEYAGGDARR